MKPESCPDPEELRSFVRCSVSEQQADSISVHLENCPACEETVVGLERAGDTIADRIKQAAAQPTLAHEHEPECQQLLEAMLDETVMSSAELAKVEAPFQIADILRDYQIVAKLGEGGMGAVYKAVHQRLKKTVALKLLATNRIGDQPAVARFEREMEVLGQLNHPHIVQALDAGEHEGQHYLVMEYVEGCDLSDIVRRCRPLSIADACLMISQAAEGLQYAHEHGFVHRDIKPSNLMLATTGAKTGGPVMVKILDLGLARALDQRPDAAAPQAELTMAGQAMGTLDYMAPEQGGDAHQVDIRADIYSLGATLYKLLTGDSPYAEHAHKPPLQRLMAIGHHEPPTIRGKRADIPEKLAAIVHRMLAKRPEQRFATPADVVQALAPFCLGADLAALVVPSGATQTIDSKAQTKALVTAASGGRGTARRLRTALAGFAALFALAAVIVISTRNGTVEVTSPDGKLPDDVQVVVSRGGDEVELLQAENQWSAKIVNGEYKVELRGGEDRFEIKDSKLTVSRMGRSMVTLQIHKPAKAPSASTVAAAPTTPDLTHSKPVTQSPEAEVAVNPERPFALVRDDKIVREFKTWGGMLADLQAGDTIEVLGRGPFLLPNPPFNHLDVTVRAAAGSRPELHLSGSNYHRASLTIIGIDLLGRYGDHVSDLVFDAAKSHGEITNCRVAAQGLKLRRGSTLKVADSMLLIRQIQIYEEGEVDFENNVIVFAHTSGCFAVGGGNQLRLTNNTIVGIQEQGAVQLLNFGSGGSLPKRPVRVEARHNLFAFDGGPLFAQHIFPGGTPEKNAAVVNWQGEENLFCPYPQPGRTTKNSDGKDVVGHPLDAWATKLNRTEREPNSQIAPWPHWKLAEAWWAKDEDYFATLRKQIEAVIPPEFRDEVGPQWDLIGPGEAYVRALAAAGTPVATADLLAEGLPGGPCVILRDGKEFQGFPRLHDACSTAVDKDVIELRTNKNVGATVLQGKGRLVTIRAGAGYSPEVGSLHVTPECRVILEGLRFAPGAMLSAYAQRPNPAEGQYVRIANCSFQTRNSPSVHRTGPVSVNHGTGDQELPLVIQNCWLDGTLLLQGRPDQPIRLDNCIVPKVDLFSTRKEDENAWHRIEFNRCAVWSPEPRHGRGGLFWANGIRHLEVVAHGTLFETPVVIRQDSYPLRWRGTKNLYRVGYPDWFHTAVQPESNQVISGLDELRNAFQSDADSIEAHPLAWEPEQWKLLPTSPGYQTGPEGKDSGVDVDRLIRAIGHDSSDRAASPAN